MVWVFFSNVYVYDYAKIDSTAHKENSLPRFTPRSKHFHFFLLSISFSLEARTFSQSYFKYSTMCVLNFMSVLLLLCSKIMIEVFHGAALVKSILLSNAVEVSEITIHHGVFTFYQSVKTIHHSILPNGKWYLLDGKM